MMSGTCTNLCRSGKFFSTLAVVLGLSGGLIARAQSTGRVREQAAPQQVVPKKEVHLGGPLQVGVAETDITPPIGFPMAGYYHERLAEGASDPLKAKAIVFRGERERAAWVVCDPV